MRLNEIDYLRPILFVQLFFVHAFTIYTDTSWDIPVGIEGLNLYNWIARISYSCMLELFTFISGYVYYFVSIKKDYSFKELVYTKFKRLILPSIVFSIFYYLLFMEHKGISVSLVYDIICGEGHLWYLPMLFGCFIVAYFIKNTKKPIFFLLIAFIASAFSRCPNVFRISQLAYYFFFFFLGICVCRYRNETLLYFRHETRRKTIIYSAIFVLSLLLLLPLNLYLKSLTWEIWIKGYFLSALIRVVNILYSTIGVFFWYFISANLTYLRPTTPNWVKQFNTLSMGVYIFHQFVLMILYYYTPLPLICGTLILPWVAIIIALPVSVLLSYLFRLSRLGKSLI